MIFPSDHTCPACALLPEKRPQSAFQPRAATPLAAMAPIALYARQNAKATQVIGREGMREVGNKGGGKE